MPVIAALKIARELLTLAPIVREAIMGIVQAFKSGSDEDQRKAYEAARRAAVVAAFDAHKRKAR
jgi:hypothetical protein